MNYRRILAIAWPLLGIALVGFGCWLIYQPAGLIAVGLLMILDAVHSTRRREKTK